MGSDIREATAQSWNDVVRVLGPDGGHSGCWCIFWRLTNQEIQDRPPQASASELQGIVSSHDPCGLLYYENDEPIGWCHAAPTRSFPRLWHTRGLLVEEPNDDSAWSIVCVYVKKSSRRAGVAQRLIDAAVEYAFAHGAKFVEGYPVNNPDEGRRTQLSSGTIAMFERAGFDCSQPASGRRMVVQRRRQS
jgi:GNAT superfamily N-acetyltransferase